MNPRLIGVAGPLHGALSRKHCVVRRAGAACTVRDLQSRNGTRVNGIPVEERELAHGDQLSVGSSVLMFLSEAEGPDARPDQMLFAETAELDLAVFRQEASERLDGILA